MVRSPLNKTGCSTGCGCTGHRCVLGPEMPSSQGTILSSRFLNPVGPQAIDMLLSLPMVLRWVPVVENGEGPIKPFAGETVLVIEPPLFGPKRFVTAGPNRALASIVDHSDCSRSMDSNSARKFPSPNPSSPHR